MWPAFDPRVRWGDYYYDVRGSKTPEDMEQDFRHNYSAAERKKEYERAAWAARENIICTKTPMGFCGGMTIRSNRLWGRLRQSIGLTT